MQIIRRNPIRTTVGAVAILSLLSIGTAQFSNLATDEAAMHMEPEGGTAAVGGRFTKHVVVESSVSTNVFQGELHFDETMFTVEEISYNTSIANIWAESPWYSRGDGTVYFIGGTTDPGGFVGSGVLLSITFRANQAGRSSFRFAEAHIMHHDGLGTEIDTVHTPIDTIFTAPEEEIAERTLFRESLDGPRVSVIGADRSFDLTGDGRYTLADLSAFMRHLLTQNSRSDFNNDDIVNLTDLSMLMDAIDSSEE